MSKQLIKQAHMMLSGKSGPLDDEELEYLAKEITKLGFKLRFARAYAAGPMMIERLLGELERKEEQINQIRAIISHE